MDKETVEENKGYSIGIPILAMAIGGLNGWMVTGTLEGLFIGVLMGVIFSVALVVAIIPIAGVFIYIHIINWLQTEIGLHLPILATVYTIFAWIITCIVAVIVLILIVISIDR